MPTLIRNRRVWTWPLAWLLLLAAAGAGAAAARAGEIVREVVDGDTVVLASGEQVRLVGIQAPKLPLGRPNFPTWPLAKEAKAALEALCLGKRIELVYGGRRVDRHGRQLAHLFDPGGRWIQGEMLAQGLARVYTFADNRARVPEMLARERAARAARRGIWSHPFYAIRQATETPQFLNSFQLVEARVLRVARVRGVTYLNFGQDWRDDFTITVPARARRLFEKAGIDLAAFEGRRVRVRGWLKPRNGPMIEASHPEQIELLEE